MITKSFISSAMTTRSNLDMTYTTTNTIIMHRASWLYNIYKFVVWNIPIRTVYYIDGIKDILCCCQYNINTIFYMKNIFNSQTNTMARFIFSFIVLLYKNIRGDDRIENFNFQAMYLSYIVCLTNLNKIDKNIKYMGGSKWPF